MYCTGRSTRRRKSDLGRPETIEETAERVTAAGGTGIAVRVDHEDEAQVKRLFRRVAREQGRLDLLVNDVWGGDVLAEWGKPFWELDLDKGLRMLAQAIHTHIITARHGVPLMVKARQGLVVEITDGDGMWYRGTLFYDLVKTSVIRLAWDFAEELRPYNVAAVAVTPGFLRSEMMLDLFEVTEANWQEAAQSGLPMAEHFLQSETPLYVGRAVAALAADSRNLEKSGRVFASWTLAKEYAFTDADGSQPDWATYFDRVFGGEFQRPLDDAYYAYLGSWQKLAEHLEL